MNRPTKERGRGARGGEPQAAPSRRQRLPALIGNDRRINQAGVELTRAEYRRVRQAVARMRRGEVLSFDSIEDERAYVGRLIRYRNVEQASADLCDDA